MRPHPHRGHRPHPGRHAAHSHTMYILSVGSVFLIGWVLYRAATLQQQAHLQTAPLQLLRRLPTVEELYGPKKGMWSSKSSGPSQLLLLSYYGSKASLLARLLMLMGVFAGEAQQLRIDVSDKLRWWELHQLTNLNDLMLQQHASPGAPPQLAAGFHVNSLTRDEREYYTDRLQGIATLLGQHKPWLIKDPRLSWFASLWLEQLEAPLCVLLVDMQPQHLAQHLALQQQQRQQRQRGVGGSSDGQEVVSAATHLERWTNSTLSSIKACFGVPTLIIPNTVLQPPLLQPFLEVLQQHLIAAGVQGTRLPSDSLLQQQYLAHLQAATPISFCGHTADSVSLAAAAVNGTAVSRAALLQDPCNWLPPKPHTGTSGVLTAAAVDSSSEQSDSSLRLPLPTQALLSALHDHLVASLAHPYSTPLQYSRTAGQMYSTYASRVKQLVAQSGAAHHPQHSEHHHSIGALIVEALRHVEGLAAEARAGPRPRLLQVSAASLTMW